MKKNNKPKDMVFILTRKTSPLSFVLNSRNTRSNPLFYWDEESNINRSLRYAKNQKSPFEDEQDGNAILEPIIFDEGSLFVPKTNPVLQDFLMYHPGFNKKFKLLDNEQDATSDIDRIMIIADSLVQAKGLSLEMTLSIARVQLGLDTNKFSIAEIKRDVLMYANNNPESFLEAINDPTLSVNDTVVKAINNGLIRFRNNNRDAYLNLPSNKTKLMGLPIGGDAVDYISDLLKSNDGMPTLELLKKNMLED